MRNKKNILYLFPGPIGYPDLPDFKDRFEMLSTSFSGLIVTGVWTKAFSDKVLGSFRFRGIRCSSGLSGRLRLAVFMIREAVKFNRLNKIDLIICYDPMFTGVVGAFLKLVLRCPLIVEINSEFYYGAINAFYGKNVSSAIRSMFMRVLSNVSLFSANGIKVLGVSVEKKLPDRFKKKPIFIFHDFVPTHYFFDKEKRFDKYILFVGHPFNLKRVDCLIRAFEKVSSDYPEFCLLLIGHELEIEAKKMFGTLSEKIKFMPGVSYDVLREYFQHCYCFVLPSSTEGMGRVLVEAMACGKPVIGTRAGGIPDLICDGINGYLFDVGDDDALSRKIKYLISNEKFAQDMGEAGLKIIEQSLSSQRYVECFSNMVRVMMRANGEKKRVLAFLTELPGNEDNGRGIRG